MKATSEGGTTEKLPRHLVSAFRYVAKGRITKELVKNKFLHTIEETKHERESNDKLLNCLGDKVGEFATIFGALINKT
jgi:hypothetical protein